MVRGLSVLLALAAVLMPAAPALALPPVITAVGQQDRHPTVTFSAPRADSVSIYIASKPDRATDGSFLQENVVETGFLADNEIQSGRWLDSSQVDPGSYFVMVRASRDYDACVSIDPNTFDSITDPLCADGFSAVVPLTVPMPTTRYTVKTEVLRSIRVLYLTLRGDPLGAELPYQLCWRQSTGKKKIPKKRCVNATLDGYSWNSDATDMLRINTKGMSRRTKFTWSARGERPKVLLTKTIKVY